MNQLTRLAAFLCMALSVAGSDPFLEPTPVASSMPAMTWADFVVALRLRIDALPFERLSPRYAAFLAKHQFEDSPRLRTDFNRVWTMFELTRDGGPWKLRWDITNQEPSSANIWRTWLAKGDFSTTTSATAECDELSALFAWLTSAMGVKKVGLVWPTSNHTIAAWEPTLPGQAGRAKAAARVMIPTSQIFLPCSATLDDTTFDPHNGRLGAYPGGDLPKSTMLPPQLVSFLLGALDTYGGATPALLALLRMHRNTRQHSSTGACKDERRLWANQVSGSAADTRAMQAYAAEMHWPGSSRQGWLAKLTE